MSSIAIVSDAPSRGIPYNHHSDESGGVIYNNSMFVAQATGRLSLSMGSLL